MKQRVKLIKGDLFGIAAIEREVNEWIIQNKITIQSIQSITDRHEFVITILYTIND